MPNIAKFLTHHEHLQPLLKWYLHQMAAVLKQPSQDYGYIQKLNSDVVGIQTYVACRGNVGSECLAEGYWYALIQSLKLNNENPKTIRIVSFINHNELHWSTSVSTFTLDYKFHQKLKKSLFETYTKDEMANITIEKLRDFINIKFFTADATHNFEIKGTDSIHIDHYDSHEPNNPISRYSNQYFKTLEQLINHNSKNGVKIFAQPKNCKHQLGNTCGDYSVFNGVVGGILELDVGNSSYQMDTVMLRTLSEHVIPALKADRSENSLALKAVQKINSLVSHLKAEKTNMKKDKVSSSPSFRKK